MSEPSTRRLPGNAAAAETLSLTFNGKTIRAVPGESIAAALTAAGVLNVRHGRLGEPRGILCGMGACFECRVTVNDGPPQRACLTPVADAMTVQTLGYAESLAAECEPAADKPLQELACDVLIIGAGPAGASAAVKLAESGRRVLVIDERHAAGGQYFKQKIKALENTGPDDRQYQQGRQLLERLHQSGATVINGATVWGAFRQSNSDIEICATTATDSYRMTTRRLVVATGAYESVPPFPGWTLPGVMTTGAAQSLMRAYRVAPGKRVLIAGNGPLNLQLACELLRAGVKVIAVAEAAPAPLPRRVFAAIGTLIASPGLALQGLGYLSTLRNSEVPIFYAHRILSAEGNGIVSEAQIAELDTEGRPLAGTAKAFSVDAVCLGYRQRPSAEIVQALGAQQVLRSTLVEETERSPVGETSVSGVYAVGDGAAPGGAQVAILEGRRVADAILGNAPDSRDARHLRRQRKFQRNLWSLYEAAEHLPPDDSVIVCRCESITARSLRDLIAAGHHNVADLKSQSRAGMGFCQGRYCQRVVKALIDEALTHASSESTRNPVESFTPRNPVKPVLIGDIAAQKPDWRGYRLANPPSYAPANRPSSQFIGDADIAIIGGGVIGTAAALYLTREGKDVVLIDRGHPNGEASGGNAGSLHLQLLPFDFDENQQASPAAATLAVQKLGIELWQQLETELDVDFQLELSGGLMLADNEADLEFLRQKASLEAKFGVETRILSAVETREMLPGVAAHVAGAAFCPGEGKINPLVATPLLLAAAQRGGLRLQTGSAVTGIDYEGSEYQVATSQGVLRCNSVINAAGGWAANIAAMIGVSLPVNSAPQQMLVTQPTNLKLPFLLSLARRHLTMKQAGNGNLIIGGGWPAGYQDGSIRPVTLRESIEGNLWVAKRILPGIGGLQLTRSWAATGVMIDGAPIIGELPGHRGFYTLVGANGYTMAPAIGRMITDLMQSGHTPLDLAPFSAARFKAEELRPLKAS